MHLPDDNLEEVLDALYATKLPPRPGTKASGGAPVPPEHAEALRDIVETIYVCLDALGELANQLDAAGNAAHATQVRHLVHDVSFGVEHQEWGDRFEVSWAERVDAMLDDTWRLPAYLVEGP